MSIIIAFIAGVCVMSISAIIAVSLSDTTHDYLTAFFVGPVMWVYLAIGIPTVKIYKAIRLYDFKKHYVRVSLFQLDKNGNKAFSGETWYIHKDLVEWFYHEGENHDNAFIRVDGDCSSAKSYPYKFERTINKNGFRYFADARDRYHKNLALARIRPYTDLYKKIEYGVDNSRILWYNTNRLKEGRPAL